MTTGEETIAVPPICLHHQHELIVLRLHILATEPWRVALIVANLLLFQAFIALPATQKRADTGDSLSDILTEAGCLACASPPGTFDAVANVLKKGISHASQVSQRKVIDDDWEPHFRSARPLMN